MSSVASRPLPLVARSLEHARAKPKGAIVLARGGAHARGKNEKPTSIQE
jgi:hypothetical protein